ncbi:MAG: cupin domain-containing protein, partial [Acidobacteria bacterium]|nr:cupin domain-containing protein [Acidobacteriota bacterium]
MKGRWQHHPGSALPLRGSVPGARQWGVSLDRVMMTYFEVAPGCLFARHAHDGEQITLVLDGELVFVFDDGQVRAGAGDVVAIPAGV